MMQTGLLVLLLSIGSEAQVAEWTRPFPPVQIADNLFYVGTSGLSAFLFTTEAGHILIDAPLQENAHLVLENIRALGLDPVDISVHLTTHAHFDHVGGLADLLQVTGGDLLVSDADAPFVASGRNFAFDSDGYPPASVTRTLSDLESVRLGDLTLTAHVTPGHTPGCTSWSGSVTIAGEMQRFVLICSLSVLEQYRLGGDDPTYSGQAADYCRSLTRLRALDADVFLGNHASFFRLREKSAARSSGDERAFVDPDGYRAFLARSGAAIDRARESQGLPKCDEVRGLGE